MKMKHQDVLVQAKAHMEGMVGLLERLRTEVQTLLDFADELKAQEASVRFDFHKSLQRALKQAKRLDITDQRTQVVFRFKKTKEAKRNWRGPSKRTYNYKDGESS